MRFLSLLLLPAAFGALTFNLYDGDNLVHDDGRYLVTSTSLGGAGRIALGHYEPETGEIYLYDPQNLLFSDPEGAQEGLLEVFTEDVGRAQGTWVSRWEVEGDVLRLNATEGVVEKNWWVCKDTYYLNDVASEVTMPCGTEGRQTDLRIVWETK